MVSNFENSIVLHHGSDLDDLTIDWQIIEPSDDKPVEI